jgi:hypothetical protein
MERDTLEFVDNLTFESELTNANLNLQFYFTDKQGREITFDKNNAPELLLFFSIDEGLEHDI